MLENSIGLILTLLVLLGPFPLAAAAVLDERTLRWPWSRRILAAGVAWFLFQASLALTLGLCGFLSRSAILCAEAALLVTGSALLVRPERRARLATGLRMPLAGFPLPFVLPMAVLGVLLLALALLRPVTDYDSLAYHLPTVATWLQTHGLTPSRQWSDTFIDAYPYSWEAVCSLFIAPFGEDLVASLPNFAIWTIFFVAVYALGRLFGATRTAGTAAAAMAACIPLVLDKLGAFHVDLPLATFFVAGLVFALAFLRERSGLGLALSCASAALVCGVKMSGLAYAAVLGIILIVGVIRFEELPRLETRHPRAGTLVLLAGALFVGGFWYVRDLFRSGNPLGMVDVRLGSMVLVPGNEPFTAFVHRTTLLALFDLTSIDHWRILVLQIAFRLGLPFLLLAVLAVPALLPRRRAEHVIGVFVLLACAGLYWVTPFSGDGGDHDFQITPWIGQALRYALPFMAVLAALAAVGMDRLRLRPRAIEIVFLAGLGGSVGVMVFNAMTSQRSFKPASSGGLLRFCAVMVASVVLITAARFALPHLGRTLARVVPAWPPRRNVVRTAALAAATLVIASACMAVVHRERLARRIRAYGASAAYLDERLPANEPVGYLLSHRAYTLFGPRLQRIVKYVPAHGMRRDRWVASLRKAGICTFAVGPVLPESLRAPVLSWLRDPTGPFERVAGDRWDELPVVYRLKGCIAVTPPPA